MQADLFPTVTSPADPLIGHAVTLDPCDGCGTTIAIIGPGCGCHAAGLRCRNCNKHRRWISHASHGAIREFVAECIARLGEPAEIVFRSFQAPTAQQTSRHIARLNKSAPADSAPFNALRAPRRSNDPIGF